MQDDVLIVIVMAVEKREDSAVYESATARLAEMVADLTSHTTKRH